MPVAMRPGQGGSSHATQSCSQRTLPKLHLVFQKLFRIIFFVTYFLSVCETLGAERGTDGLADSVDSVRKEDEGRMS
jgi:hypothetical protein